MLAEKSTVTDKKSNGLLSALVLLFEVKIRFIAVAQLYTDKAWGCVTPNNTAHLKVKAQSKIR
jgi:hypothetical protein